MSFFDSKIGQNCVAQLAADGKTRCLPLGQNVAPGLFADAACTAAVSLNNSATKAPYATTLASANATCADKSKVTVCALGDSVAAASLFQKSGDQCLPVTPTTAKAYECYQFALIGAEAAPADFVELQQVVLD